MKVKGMSRLLGGLLPPATRRSSEIEIAGLCNFIRLQGVNVLTPDLLLLKTV